MSNKQLLLTIMLLLLDLIFECCLWLAHHFLRRLLILSAHFWTRSIITRKQNLLLRYRMCASTRSIKTLRWFYHSILSRHHAILCIRLNQVLLVFITQLWILNQNVILWRIFLHALSKAHRNLHHSHMSDITNVLLREYLLALIVVNDIDLVPYNKSRMLFVLPFLDIYAVVWASTILLIEIKHLLILMVLSLGILLNSSSYVVLHSFFLVTTYYDAIVIALIQGSRIWTRALLLQLTHTETQGVILMLLSFVALFNRMVNISLIVVI